MSFKHLDVKEFNANPFTTIGDEWMLLSAGNEENGYNTMTVSWGHMGIMWGKGMPTAVAYVRPQRYTKEFMDREGYFTLSVLGEEYKKQLAYLGSHSGRDGDKIKETGLTPAFGNGSVYFEEAKMVLVCRKLYQAPLREDGFVDKTIVEESYPNKDFHEMYVGEIVEILVRE